MEQEDRHSLIRGLQHGEAAVWPRLQAVGQIVQRHPEKLVSSPLIREAQYILRGSTAVALTSAVEVSGFSVNKEAQAGKKKALDSRLREVNDSMRVTATA